MSYVVNGTSMNIGPAAITWNPIVAIIDHNQQPVYAGFDVVMQFPESNIEDGAQWLDAVSSGSVNLTIPTRWGLSFSTLSGVYVELVNVPTQEDIHLTPFTLVVHGVYL
jgi:hypothetical protein